MDLITLVPALPVPVFLPEGRLDTVTPAVVARRYFDRLSAPHKEWMWFDHSDHGVVVDEPEKAGMVIRTRVRQIEQQHRAGSVSQTNS